MWTGMSLLTLQMRHNVWWVGGARSADEYLVRNIFEVLFTEEGTGLGKAIFEGGFKSGSSEARSKVDSTYLEHRVAIEEQSWSD